MAVVQERANATKMKGQPLTLKGEQLEIGSRAPDFIAVKNDLSDLDLQSLAGKTLLILSVPSLDTSVCATETRRFNKEATSLSEDVVILTISMDLPFAQQRYCAAEGIDRVITVSDYKYRDFGEKYGVLIKELGLLARAVFVVDKSGHLTYVDYLDEIANEPDYQKALDAVKKSL